MGPLAKILKWILVAVCFLFSAAAFYTKSVMGGVLFLVAGNTIISLSRRKGAGRIASIVLIAVLCFFGIGFASGKKAGTPAFSPLQTVQAASPTVPGQSQAGQSPQSSSVQNTSQTNASQTNASQTSPAQSTQQGQTAPTGGGESERRDYVMNVNTFKFHYPDCESVELMNEENKREYGGTREDIISWGYEPCENCNP